MRSNTPAYNKNQNNNINSKYKSIIDKAAKHKNCKNKHFCSIKKFPPKSQDKKKKKLYVNFVSLISSLIQTAFKLAM